MVLFIIVHSFYYFCGLQTNQRYGESVYVRVNCFNDNRVVSNYHSDRRKDQKGL